MLTCCAGGFGKPCPVQFPDFAAMVVLPALVGMVWTTFAMWSYWHTCCSASSAISLMPVPLYLVPVGCVAVQFGLGAVASSLVASVFPVLCLV